MTAKTLLQTLTDENFPTATGLLLSATACEWAQWHRTKISGADQPNLASQCYEARFFCEHAELRWRAGAATDSSGAKLGKFARINAGEKRGSGNHYVLWGKLDAGGKNLTQLPRKMMQIPVAGAQGDIVVLVTEEIRRKDCFGNVYVRDERWIGLKTYSENRAKKLLGMRHAFKKEDKKTAKESSHDA